MSRNKDWVRVEGMSHAARGPYQIIEIKDLMNVCIN